MRSELKSHAVRREPGDNGFTLIELAVTGLVMSIGMLALFTYLRIGIISKTQGGDDFRVMSFAHDTIETLRMVSDNLSSSPDTNAWSDFWIDFAAGKTNIAITPPSFSNETLPDESLVGASADADSWKIYRNPGYGTNSIVSYRFDILITNSLKGAFTDDSIFGDSPTNRVDLSLRVKPDAAPYSGEQLFFTTFSR